MLGSGPQGLRPWPSPARRRCDRWGRGTEAAPPRPSRPHPAGGVGPPLASQGSSAPAGAAAGAARGGAARAARSGPARPGEEAAAAATATATPEPVGAVREAVVARPQRGEAWGLEAAAAAMPLLFLERFPWPSLRTYTGLSGLALLGTIVSAYRALSQPEARPGPGPAEAEPVTAPVQPDPAALVRPSTGGPRARDVAQYLLSDSLFVWVSEAAGPAEEERRGAGRGIVGTAMSPIICGGRGWGRGPLTPGPLSARPGGRGPARVRATEGPGEGLGWGGFGVVRRGGSRGQGRL